MALTIKSDDSTDELRIDPVSKAAHVTIYDAAGNPINPAVAQAGIVIDANNTTTAVLAAGATFTGTGTEILNYSQINIQVFGRPGVVAGDGSSAKASLFLEFSKDNINWDISIPSLVRDPSLVIPTPLINAHRYFRVRYLNDGGVAAIAALGLDDTAGTPTLQTIFRLTSYLLPNSTKELARTMDQGIQGSDSAVLVRAGIMGRNPELSYINKTSSGLTRFQNSTTPLGIGGIFLGSDYENVLGYSNFCINVDTDQAGTLQVLLSSDGVNVTSTITRTFTNTNAGQSYVFIPTSKFIKVRFTNTSGIAQTFLRLASILKAEALGLILQPTNTPLTENSLGFTVVSVPNDGSKTTYSASVQNIAPVLTPTDIFTISGSATKTIRVTRVTFNAVKTVASNLDVLLIKRSTANTGGISTTATNIPHDSNSAAATAVVLAYTGNPVVGAAVGNVRGRKVFVPAGGAMGEYLEYDFGSLGQCIVLRGVAQSLSLNLNGVSMTGGLCNCFVEWTEE